MNNIYKAFLNFIKMHKIWSATILIVVLGIIWYSFAHDKKPVNTDFAVAEIGGVKEIVSVTGNVKPLSNVDLSFERGGRLASVNVSVGDKVYSGQILASVSNADLVANLDQATANLKKVKAVLGDTADKAALTLAQTRTSLLNDLRDAYTKADDAVRNKMFSLFNDPVRYNAKLSFSTDALLQEDIEDGKDVVTDNLNLWYRALIKLDENSDLEPFYLSEKKDLSAIMVLLDKCATAVSGLDPETDFVTQTQIDAWKLNISTARTNINTTIDTLTSSFDQYKSAGLAMKISRNNTLSEEASVEQAKAQVASAEAELAKTIIRSPISGVVTDLPIKLGEIVSINQKAVSVISYGDYEVESFVPEADIAKVKIGNLASTTLDAYGSGVNFETKVIKIDPAATVINGVPTYKVTLKFLNQDERIRSGMTANLEILTAEKSNIVTVVSRAVYTRDNNKYVKVINPDNTTSEVMVVVGLRGNEGDVEIVSGLKEGEKVSTAI